MNASKEKAIRSKWLTIRLTENEEMLLRKFSRQTTTGSLSKYARNILLHKPVILKFRNQSLDEMLTQFIQLKRELNAIGNNLNQSVHRLHTLDHSSEMKSWIINHENNHRMLENKSTEIKDWMSKLYESWSQE